MKKAELARHIAAETEVHDVRVVRAVVEATFKAMATALRERREFAYPGFGALRVRVKGAMRGRDPQTGEMVQIPERRRVVFRPAHDLKQALNKK